MPTFETAKAMAQVSGRNVPFRNGNVVGLIRYHGGNWYWVNLSRVKHIIARRNQKGNYGTK
jgi:hypothetical protein